MQGFKHHSKSTKQVHYQSPEPEDAIHPSLLNIGLYVTNQNKPYIPQAKQEQLARVRFSPKSKIDNKLSEKLTPKRDYKSLNDLSRNGSRGPVVIQGSGSVERSLS